MENDKKNKQKIVNITPLIDKNIFHSNIYLNIIAFISWIVFVYLFITIDAVYLKVIVGIILFLDIFSFILEKYIDKKNQEEKDEIYFKNKGKTISKITIYLSIFEDLMIILALGIDGYTIGGFILSVIFLFLIYSKNKLIINEL